MKKLFEEAINKHTIAFTPVRGIEEAANKCAAIHKEECLAFTDWCIRDYYDQDGLWYKLAELTYSENYDQQEPRSYTTAQLFDLFNEDKTIKP